MINLIRCEISMLKCVIVINFRKFLSLIVRLNQLNLRTILINWTFHVFCVNFFSKFVLLFFWRKSEMHYFMHYFSIYTSKNQFLLFIQKNFFFASTIIRFQMFRHFKIARIRKRDEMFQHDVAMLTTNFWTIFHCCCHLREFDSHIEWIFIF